MPHVLVIGAGISGLAAAIRIRDRASDDYQVTVVDQAPRAGGKIRTEPISGLNIETGAESFLARRSEPLALIERLGLTDRIRYPAKKSAGLVIGDKIRSLPAATSMGVPSNIDAVVDAGILTKAGIDRLSAETQSTEPILAPDEDAPVGALVRSALGDEVVERLVDPLLGGVYAGYADDLSIRVTIPALADALTRNTSMTRAAAEVAPKASAKPRPVFGSLDGGLSELVDAAAAELGDDLRLSTAVRELRRHGLGWKATVGSTRDAQLIEADAVVLAVPAAPAARLMSTEYPVQAESIKRLDYASIALITVVFDDIDLPDRSGFLVPAGFGYTIKAATFFTTKWPHIGGTKTVVRMSVGRFGDERVLQCPDDELVDAALRDLAMITGTELVRPVSARVNRWGGGLPQYTSGHLNRIATVRRSLSEEPIALAGAAFDGVGIASCIASGNAACDTLLGPAVV